MKGEGRGGGRISGYCLYIILTPHPNLPPCTWGKGFFLEIQLSFGGNQVNLYRGSVQHQIIHEIINPVAWAKKCTLFEALAIMANVIEMILAGWYKRILAYTHVVWTIMSGHGIAKKP